jgi:hypothetical protein
MDLAGRMPADLIPVSALAVVHCLDPETGAPVLWWSTTPGLPTWELDGMCGFVRHNVRADWDEFTSDNSPAAGEEE